MKFILDNKLAEDTFFIQSLELSELLIRNNKHYTWLILVPRIENAVEIIDIVDEDQIRLCREIKSISNLLKSLYPSCKLNIASIGNITPQLHIHIIARHTDDISWPNVVWGREGEKYSILEKNKIIDTIKENL